MPSSNPGQSSGLLSRRFASNVFELNAIGKKRSFFNTRIVNSYERPLKSGPTGSPVVQMTNSRNIKRALFTHIMFREKSWNWHWLEYSLQCRGLDIDLNPGGLEVKDCLFLSSFKFLHSNSGGGRLTLDPLTPPLTRPLQCWDNMCCKSKTRHHKNCRWECDWCDETPENGQ